MYYKKWKPIYKKIIKDFNFNIEDDEKTSLFLNKFLEKNKNLYSIKKIKNMINNQEIVIFGAGPSLKKSIYKNKKSFEDKIKIAADGATSALIEYNMRPDIIVTDLDGKISDQIMLSSMGVLTVIHAHGNNFNKIKKYIEKFDGDLIGTTQINPSPYYNLNNFGGFTDGDRAVFLSDHFHAKKIYLIGFDFNGKIGKYSFAENKDKKLKRKKLKWCKYLIEELSKQNDIKYL